MSAPARKSRQRLTVALVVYCDQSLLPVTLESVKTLADEIVIEDVGSWDESVQVAQSYSARIRQAEWTESFSDAKNALLKRVIGDWVLWLEPGETLTEASLKELREFINTEADKSKAYMVAVEGPTDDDSGSREQTAELRLFSTKAGLTFKGRIRESVRESMEEREVTIGLAPGVILQDERRNQFEKKSFNAHLALRLANLEMAEHEKTPARLDLAIGDALCDLGDFVHAAPAYSNAVEHALRGSTEQLEAYYGLLSAMDRNPILQPASLETCLHALEIFPLDAQLLLAMGGYVQARNRGDLALRAFESAVRNGRVDLETWRLLDLPEVAVAFYAMALRAQGQEAEALAQLEDGLTRFPKSTRLIKLAIDLSVKLDKDARAIELAEGWAETPRDKMLLADVARAACLAMKKSWPEALALLQRAYAIGCEHPLCFQWLTFSLVSNGQFESAKVVLEHWRKVAPNDLDMQTYSSAICSEEALHKSDEESRESQAELDGRFYRVDDAANVSAAEMPKPAFVTQAESEKSQLSRESVVDE